MNGPLVPKQISAKLIKNFWVLPCLLLLMRPILAGSVLGCVTAIGAVLVIVVMVAAGIIRVDIIHYSSADEIFKILGVKNFGPPVL